LGGEPSEVTKGPDCENCAERESEEPCLRIARIHSLGIIALFLYIYMLCEGLRSADIDFVAGACYLPLWVIDTLTNPKDKKSPLMWKSRA
jgi:hypothetical protein